MKCSDVSRLVVTQRLTRSDIEELRNHARKCSRCAAEIEGLLAAMTTDSASLDTPPPSFADNIMARIEVLPVPRRVTTEHIFAMILFIASVAGLSALTPFLSRMALKVFANAIRIEGFASLIEDIVGTFERISDFFAVWVPALLNATRESVGANLVTASILVCALAVILYAAKPTQKRRKLIIRR